MHSGLFWWIGAGVLIVLELMHGTFYLLMVALGFIAAALARLAGADLPLQFGVAAVVALGAVIVLRKSRYGRKTKTRAEAARNPDVNLDIGSTLTVPAWHDGRARTSYRGASWEVELSPGEPEDANLYEITALRGNCLVVVARKHAART
ncbi:Membrane protein implicated in regulation of membrane protease activity [Paraburkholderia piptadeniae]|uniref:Membrane protein implicated in regulation of membrane protease activity n=2 Tax=Paraburkholderia piptadeniae TaxID=1701573 RepID=A0A1N7S549_9BURK|nr:Membrane protein implicated in regulation of membrane protease activity [Paraburkholderia piptadeniae]